MPHDWCLYFKNKDVCNQCVMHSVLLHSHESPACTDGMNMTGESIHVIRPAELQATQAAHMHAAAACHRIHASNQSVRTAHDSVGESAGCEHVQTPATRTSRQSRRAPAAPVHRPDAHICTNRRVFTTQARRKHASRVTAERPRPLSARSEQQSAAARGVTTAAARPSHSPARSPSGGTGTACGPGRSRSRRSPTG